VKIRAFAATVAAIIGAVTFSATTSGAATDSVVSDSFEEFQAYEAGRYIVKVVEGEVVGAVMNDHPRVRAKARQFQSVIHGFSAALTAQEVHDLAMDRRVVSVVEDPVISLVAPQSRSTVVGGSNDVWGLDRTNQRTLPLDDTFSATADGSGVYVYVVDAPIRITHSQFSARVLSGFSAPGINFLTGCDDHGTHVAGTVLGTTVGVAPGAQLIPVEVLDGNGDGLVSDVIS